jgi:hypothetical protein
MAAAAPDSAAAAQWILAWIVVPLWIAAGFIDGWCHRRARIERSSGVRESVLHLLLFVEVGLPLLAVLFLRVNALVFALMLLGFVAHELTVMADLRHATRERTIAPFEQHVHSFLELMPLAAILLLAVLHPGQMLALWGLGVEAADLQLAWKEPPLPPTYVAGVLAAAFFLGALPYIGELMRALAWRDALAQNVRWNEQARAWTAAAHERASVARQRRASA